MLLFFLGFWKAKPSKRSNPSPGFFWGGMEFSGLYSFIALLTMGGCNRTVGCFFVLCKHFVIRVFSRTPGS